MGSTASWAIEQEERIKRNFDEIRKLFYNKAALIYGW